jgi:uncharacterized protein (TIGR02453 family)
MARAASRRGFFGPETIEFLADLSSHNDREWFEANRDRYESAVREPALAFIRAMKPLLKSISKQLVADDRKLGGSLMRVHRDTRFAKDKRPYKTNVGIQFRHSGGKDVHAPGLYLHIAPDECFLGMGSWRPEPKVLDAYRALILEDPKRWKRVTGDAALTKLWSFGGESLKRPPRGVAPDHPCIDDLKRKDFILGADLDVEDVFSPKLDEKLIKRFATGKKYMQFLCDAIEAPF